MLHCEIVVSKKRDTSREIGTRSLNARSLALSALLGTHPPALPASSLVALAELFGINGGTMRTALSRLVAAGDLTLDSGSYALAARLRQRQIAQDAGRSAAPETWNGTWHTAVAVADARDLADRRHVRVIMVNARFGELRPTVWMRPANLLAPVIDGDWVLTTGAMTGRSGKELVDELWDLATLADRARSLHDQLSRAAIDRSDPEEIPRAFVLSATVVRFLRDEPLLPADLEPNGWPIAGLRQRYDEFESDLQAMMRPFLTAHEVGFDAVSET